jgi:drug/metabolite transporter (DMT)-like permease
MRLKPSLVAQLLLLSVVIVWGSTFVIVKTAVEDALPLLFNLMRMTMALIALALLNWRHLRELKRRTLTQRVDSPLSQRDYHKQGELLVWDDSIAH